MTSLHLAAEGNRTNMVDYLLDQGATITIQDDYGVILHTNAGKLVWLPGKCCIDCSFSSFLFWK